MIERIYEAYLECEKVSIDTRKKVEDSMFFGINGENFNGSRYAEQAIKKGAKYAIVDTEKYAVHPDIFLVDDALDTLQDLASLHRRNLNIPVMGITGSNGKTTTKELINHLLKAEFNAFCTQGNFNNHIGLPLTILSTPRETEILILEMGASAIGEIAFLCNIGNPTHGLITNISEAHLKGFGSLEGVKQAKAELYRHLEKNDGLVFVNMDEPYLNALSTGIEDRILYSYEKYSPKLIDYLYTLDKTFPEIQLHYESLVGMINCHVPLYGKYNAMNVATAISVARYFNLADSQIVEKLLKFKTYSNRSEKITGRNNQYLMDAYNANPASMKNSIEAFAQMSNSHPKILILGDMKELGTDSVQFHQEIIEKIQKYTWEDVYVIGPRFMQCQLSPVMKAFPTTDSFISYLDKIKLSDKFILLKGSRSMALEHVKDTLESHS